MDQEQPNFKVTDRRLFNADGSPRELPEEEKPVTPAEVTVAAEFVASEPAVAAEPVASEPAVVQPPEEPILDEPLVDDDAELSEAELAEARDPASFVNFLISIAQNAASSLGMMEHPVTHQRNVDLELGKHWIDVLGMIELKTKGNLSKQEKQMIEGLLADLRMQYVSLSNSAPKPKFSASDITGGK